MLQQSTFKQEKLRLLSSLGYISGSGKMTQKRLGNVELTGYSPEANMDCICYCLSITVIMLTTGSWCDARR